MKKNPKFTLDFPNGLQEFNILIFTNLLKKKLMLQMFKRITKILNIYKILKRSKKSNFTTS